MSYILKPEFGGGIIALRNLDDTSKFASSEFAAIAIDELTKNKKEVFDQFRSIMRWPGIDETKFIAGTNPGGVGHEWVRQLWIDKVYDVDEPEPERFHFIQAFARDNPHISKAYVRQLSGLPEAMRKAFLEGSWDLYEGQYFTEWRQDVHVVDPIELPSEWRRIRCIDHGRTKATACLWGAIDYDGRIWWYREYGRTGVDADVNAQQIARMSWAPGQEGIVDELKSPEKYWFSVMDSSCFSKMGGETIADIYLKNGVSNEPWPKNRLAGWALFHEYLRIKDDGLPSMFFFKNCLNSIRTIPTMVHDKNKPEDLDSVHSDDHWCDAIRGALEYLNEGRSKKPLNPIEARLKAVRDHGRVSPGSLKRFYANR